MSSDESLASVSNVVLKSTLRGLLLKVFMMLGGTRRTTLLCL